MSGITKKIDVCVIGGNIERLDSRSCRLELLSFDRKAWIDFQASVIKHISTGITVCEWGKIKQNLDYLRDIPFHAVGRNDGIDVLIGADFLGCTEQSEKSVEKVMIPLHV